MSDEDADLEFARSVFFVEKELGVFVDEDYPLMKYFSQVENLEWYFNEKEKNQRKQDNKTNTTLR